MGAGVLVFGINVLSLQIESPRFGGDGKLSPECKILNLNWLF
jgi:hypothetical protein